MPAKEERALAGLLVIVDGTPIIFKVGNYPLRFNSPLRKRKVYWITDPETRRHVGLKTPSRIGLNGEDLKSHRLYLLEPCD